MENVKLEAEIKDQLHQDIKDEEIKRKIKKLKKEIKKLQSELAMRDMVCLKMVQDFSEDHAEESIESAYDTYMDFFSNIGKEVGKPSLWEKYKEDMKNYLLKYNEEKKELSKAKKTPHPKYYEFFGIVIEEGERVGCASGYFQTMEDFIEKCEKNNCEVVLSEKRVEYSSFGIKEDYFKIQFPQTNETMIKVMSKTPMIVEEILFNKNRFSICKSVDSYLEDRIRSDFESQNEKSIVSGFFVNRNLKGSPIYNRIEKVNESIQTRLYSLYTTDESDPKDVELLLEIRGTSKEVLVDDFYSLGSMWQDDHQDFVFYTLSADRLSGTLRYYSGINVTNTEYDEKKHLIRIYIKTQENSEDSILKLRDNFYALLKERKEELENVHTKSKI